MARVTGLMPARDIAAKQWEHPLMAPLCVKGPSFPPVDGAPVLAVVKQTALDVGCGSALLRGGGIVTKNGLGWTLKCG